MSKFRPEGIIDDIFLPVGKKAVHEVRTGVREILRKQKIAAEKAEKAAKYTAGKQTRYTSELKSVEQRLVRNMDRKVTLPAKKAAGEKTTATAKQQLSMVGGKKPIRSIESSKNYQKDLSKSINMVAKKFPTKESFERALKEEARDLKKKAPAKKVAAKKPAAKKVAAKKTPKASK